MKRTSDQAWAYSRQNAGRFASELFEMLRIPSLSGDPARAADVRTMVEWLTAHMHDFGLDEIAVMETAGHPVVYGGWMGAVGAHAGGHSRRR